MLSTVRADTYANDIRKCGFSVFVTEGKETGMLLSLPSDTNANSSAGSTLGSATTPTASSSVQPATASAFTEASVTQSISHSISESNVASASSTRAPQPIVTTSARAPSRTASSPHSVSESTTTRYQLRTGTSGEKKIAVKDTDDEVLEPSATITTAAWMFALTVLAGIVFGLIVYMRRHCMVPSASPHVHVAPRRRRPL